MASAATTPPCRLIVPTTFSWHEVPECTSTQELASIYQGEIPSDGVFFWARRQSQGRGRVEGRSWLSPEGGVYLSWLLSCDQPSGMTLLGGLAVARTLQAWGLEPWLKWPNDCWVAEAKISGVLADFARGRLVLGLGLNVSSPVEELPAEATSMAQHLDAVPTVTDVAYRLRDELLGLWGVHCRRGLAGYLEDVRKISLAAGRRVEVQVQGEQFQDVVVGLDDSGFLRLQSGRTLVSVDHLRALPLP